MLHGEGSRIPWGWPLTIALLGMALLVGVLALIAYWSMFSSTGSADDTGYVLISLRQFYRGQALYDQVYSQYGPGYFVLLGGAMKVLGVPFTMDGARYVDLVLWVCSSLVCGVSLLRLTGSPVIALSAILVAFKLLSALTFTPLHPISSISLLLISLICAAAFLLPARPRAGMAAIGALTAALLLIKVNVGLLAAVAVGFAYLITWRRLESRRALRLAACALLVVVPFALVSGNLDLGWAARYALVVSLGLAAFAFTALGLRGSSVPAAPHLKSFAFAAAAALVLILAVPLAGGTTVSGLVRGVILDPLRMPGVFTLPLVQADLAPLWPAAGLVAAALVRWRLPPYESRGRWLRGSLGALRVIAGLTIWLVIVWPTGFEPNPAGVAVGSALAWIVVVPVAGKDGVDPFVRALLGGIALLQLLHGYPVGGDQLAPSELPLVVVGGVCIADGSSELASLPAGANLPLGSWRPAAFAGLALFTAWLCLVPLRDTSRLAKERFDAGVPLGLPGADHTRFPPYQAQRLRRLTASINAHCKAFLTMPGQNSLYLLTEQDPPTGMNATAWMWLFDAQRQQQIVDQVVHRKGLCEVKYPLLTAGFGLGPVPNRPLVRFLEQKFELAESFGRAFDRYQLLTRR